MAPGALQIEASQRSWYFFCYLYLFVEAADFKKSDS